jgi:hypothetical protein
MTEMTLTRWHHFRFWAGLITSIAGNALWCICFIAGLANWDAAPEKFFLLALLSWHLSEWADGEVNSIVSIIEKKREPA